MKQFYTQKRILKSIALLFLIGLSFNVSGQTTGTADGTYNFGSLGTSDSGGTGFKLQGDKFKVSNAFLAFEPVIYLNNTQDANIIIKAEGGSTMKTATVSDINIGSAGSDETVTQFNITLKDFSGSTIATHTFTGTQIVSSSGYNISSFGFTNSWPTGGYDNVSEINIHYILNTLSSNFEFRTITLSNISADIGPSNNTPTISLDNSNLIYTENNAATQIDAAGTVSDSDGDADWNGGGLTVQVTANSESADEISISDTDGDGTAITISGTNLLANGTDIGDLTASGGVVTGGTMLSIVFDSDATNANVQEVLQSLRYRNTSDDPGTANKTITINATDKNAANSSDTRTISIIAVNDEPVLISTGLNPTFTEGESAVGLFQSTSASTVESGQTFSDFTMTVSNVNNGSNERLNVDGTTIVLTNGTSGTTAGNSLGYNVSVSGTITTVNFSGGTLSTLSLQTLIDAISYQNNSNSPNTANRTVIITSIKDSGGTANSGDDTAALSVNSTVTVVAVNDKPTGANFTANSIYKGTSYVFSTSDFGFTDIDGDIMTKIAVNLVPQEGILYVDADNDDDYDAGEELANADNVTKADLDNGNLQYYNDTGINSYFEFAVYDGTAYSASTYTATLNIIAFPTVTTQAVSSITATTATGNGNINDLGIPNPTAHGVCWSTSENPTTAGSKDDKGATSATGAYTASITGLTAGTTYYARAFATNDAGTVYGSQVSFTTNTPPTVKNRTFTDIHKGNIYPNIGNIAIDYEDDGGDNLQNIRISALPGNGILFLNPNNNGNIDDGEAIVVNQLISRDHINWGYLQYLNTDGVSSSFTYEASDGTDYSNTATVTLSVKATPTVTFTNIAQTISEATETITITAQLSEAINYAQVTVPFSVDGSSSATSGGVDYSISGSPIKINAGSLSKTIVITVNNDDLDEPDETVIVNMGEPTNAIQGATSTFTANIIDNDLAPTVAFNKTSSDGFESVSSADLQVNLSAESGLPISVDYKVNGTANTTGDDCLLANGTLSFLAGESSRNITIASIVDNLIDEYDETVIVTLSNPSNATLGTNTVHTYTIKDDDDAPLVSFTSASQSSIGETGTMTITAQLSAASEKEITVPFELTGDCTANQVVDFSLSSGSTNFPEGTSEGNLTIAPGDTEVQLTINILEDALDEENEIVGVRIGTPVNATASGTTNHLATITDDDDPPAVTFTNTAQATEEGDVNLNIQVHLTAMSDKQITVPLVVNGESTATGGGADYSQSGNSITFIPGDPNDTKSITITIKEDALDEASETVVIDMGELVNASPGEITQHTITINDDDPAPSIEFSSTNSEGLESISQTDLQVNLSAASGYPVSVDYVVQGTSTATGSGTDYTLANGTLSFAEGETSKIISITDIIDDTLDEEDETIEVIIANPNNATIGAKQTHTYTILDNDNPPTVSFTTESQVSSNESGTMQITAELSAISGRDVSVDFSVNETSTASGAGVDYSIENSPLNFAAGSTLADITIAISMDMLDESDESVIVDMVNITNATQGAIQSHRVRIKDDDHTPIITANQTFDVDENKDNNAVIGTVLASDEDAGTSFSQWLIVGGNDDGIFAINTTSGVISIADNTNLDFEQTESYTLSITVSDGVNTSPAENVRIDINDLNDNIPVVTASQTFDVDENKDNNAVVGTVLASDLDAGTSFSQWLIVSGNDDGIFAINAASGEISIADNTNLDFEQTESYTLSITVSDGSNTSLAENIRIDINDLNDNIPVVIANQTFNVDENKANNTIIGTVMATDNDAGTSFSAWKITAGNTDGIFELNASSGEISIADNTNLDYETTTSYTLSLTVSDGTNISASETINIDVNPINDITPVITCC
uniref:Calx-beta domain-containing protein n=1 Tax=Marinifilum flexuosum TaxID=1117708 RepID=UPI00249144B1